ncbi:PEP motif putative anchor domain protein [Nitrosomonas sp. Is79A3]|uniref:FxDxF family PEP-CTERM protein n=1 Tax=Nitrosomonas sp. (strain Is79A3) TaxID=261292 RepID=UPI000215D352
MKNSYKLNLVAAVVLMASSVAHAGIANLPGDGSQANAYQMGVISSTPTVLAAIVSGSSSSFFEEYADFTISGANLPFGSASTLLLTLNGVNVSEITGLTVEVWDNVHPNGTTLLTTFSGNNVTTPFGLLPDGQYHLDISGYLGDAASVGQYSVAISAVPEPETYAMLLAGLGLIGFSTRRRMQG